MSVILTSGATALGLETAGSVCLILVKAMVLGCYSASLDWARVVVLDFGGGFSTELIGVGPKVLTKG